MRETANGTPNEHPELTAMKSVQERRENEMHPSQIHNIGESFNYYTYGWMREQNGASTMNYVALITFVAIIAVCVYLLVGTKLVRFI